MDAWAMMSSERELYVAKALTNFKHLKGGITFLLISEKKDNLHIRFQRKEE